jgi:hypothetical protein
MQIWSYNLQGKGEKKIQFWLVKFTSMDINCKQCIFQAFIHILETFVGHN